MCKENVDECDLCICTGQESVTIPRWYNYTMHIQNVPFSKRPTLITSHSQNVPSLNIPHTKRPTAQNVPLSKRPTLRTSHALNVPRHKTSQKNVPRHKTSQKNVPRHKTSPKKCPTTLNVPQKYSVIICRQRILNDQANIAWFTIYSCSYV